MRRSNCNIESRNFSRNRNNFEFESPESPALFMSNTRNRNVSHSTVQGTNTATCQQLATATTIISHF